MKLRDAQRTDVPTIVRMLADDELGAAREKIEDPLPQGYYAAFEAIEADPNNRLLVAELDGEIIGTLQLTFIPGLSRVGAEHAQIEAVRIASHLRGKGFGKQLIAAVIDIIRKRGCAIVQLSSSNSRTDAHRFYQQLGFATSHVGMKLILQ
ncbi:MAG TPA: GNAT family N-acetyltransferase [Xanthobacteraceae bacterium]|jgi:GNAT superfamily N-acetyltransferase|nr:GNAT family N-acetyltransferase [Xanthobacteraceae bacterium]